jgi:MFS family permease
LSGEAIPETAGRVFGFHRSMDTLGAVLGPLMALAWLYYRPADYRTLFVLAFAPGLLSVLCTFWVREKSQPPAQSALPGNAGFFAFASYWKRSTPQYRRLVTGLLVFQLFNSSDTFLLLKMKTAGLSDAQLIGVYLFYNTIFALFSYPLGILADRYGIKKVFLSGLALFALTYTGFAVNRDLHIFYILFFAYGMYAAATQGLAKAWISNLCDKKEVATAIGTYTGFQSIAALAASASAGVLWEFLGENAPFLFSAAGACGVMAYLSWVRKV